MTLSVSGESVFPGIASIDRVTLPRLLIYSNVGGISTVVFDSFMDHRENDDIVDTEFLQNQQQRIVPIVVLWTLLRIKNVLSFFFVFFFSIL